MFTSINDYPSYPAIGIKIALKTMFESMMILVIDANLFFNPLPAAFFYFIYKLVYIFLRS
jgi:hypothetical protein